MKIPGSLFFSFLVGEDSSPLQGEGKALLPSTPFSGGRVFFPLSLKKK